MCLQVSDDADFSASFNTGFQYPWGEPPRAFDFILHGTRASVGKVKSQRVDVKRCILANTMWTIDTVFLP